MGVQFSDTLEQIANYAGTLPQNTPGAFTAEGFVVAVIDLIQGKFIPKNGNDLAESMQSLMQGLPLDTMKTNLLQYINEKKNSTLVDDLYLRKRITELQMKMGGDLVITPELLMKCILNTPSEAIRRCMQQTAARKGIEDLGSSMSKSIAEVLKGAGIQEEIHIPSAEGKKEQPAPQHTADTDKKKQVAALTEKVKGIRKMLMDTVFGQDKAVSVFTSGYFQSELLSLTDKNRVRPATFLFAGPPGVGKTFLAENIAKALELPFSRFDMSEYCDKEASLEFCGSDKVYKEAKAGNFTSFVAENPKCVVLFDEIEKAHMSIIHLFLQILDAGRIRDNFTDKEIELKDTILIFTTNAGKKFYENSELGDFSTVSRKVILKALQDDVNPATGTPFFPAAICSRFASGNVVMFNNISAHNLRGIAKREVLRQAGNFEREIGTAIEIDERVYSALLFAEGGAADARTVRSRAEAFLDGELFELFRLMEGDVSALEKIHMDVELSSCDEDTRILFEEREPTEILLFASPETGDACRASGAKCVFHTTGDADMALETLRSQEIGAIVLDMLYGTAENGAHFLNIEDEDSAARKFFRCCRELYGEIPLYILETPAHVYTTEEQVSFMREGIRGFVRLEGDGSAFADRMNGICEGIHQQAAMQTLARANQIVTFETSQRITGDGKTAEIRLFDFTLQRAMDAEDAKDILSDVSKPNVRFEQVIGAEDAKEELKYFVEYLKNPKKYKGTGARVPRGVLLYGPPGTGKTMLAKAMACESDVTFISAEGNQFLKKYVGEGPEAVHELFRKARRYAPSILFIDEIDAVARERRGSDTPGIEATLTALLTEMDGFRRDNSKPVFVLAATNFDIEPGGAKSLDPALMRRFDRRIYIDLPNKDDRIRYMREKMAKLPACAVSEGQLENIAVRSTGMSLAGLESVLEMALRLSIRSGDMTVTDAVLVESFETFNNGEKKDWDISQLERVARHEAGHALLCWMGGEKPSYVTVAARGDHGGYMQHDSQEGKAIYTKAELLARIRTALGGRAAELVCYGPEDGISTGAGGDLRSATALAENLICSYGMHEGIGLAVVDRNTLYTGPLAVEIHQAVVRILEEELATAVRLLEEKRDVLDRFVETLIARTHLNGDEIQKLLQEC